MGQLQNVTSLKDQAYQSLSNYGELLRSKDLPTAIHSDNAWKRFESHPSEIQKMILDRFNQQFSVITELNQNKVDFRDPIQSVWRILNQFHWKQPHDLFEKIQKTDIVEIYLPDQTQLYRNMNYFNFTSYSLSELLFYSWDELFIHQEGFHEKLAGIVNKIFIEQSPEDYHDFSEPYIGHEKFSAGKLAVKLRCKAISPLKGRDSGMNEALIAVWSMELAPEFQKSYSNGKTVEVLNEKEATC